LRRRGEIPALPLYLNSPMAIAATDIYRRFQAEHRASDADLTDMFELATPVHSVEESKALNERRGPMIIISASGMLTGGRVLHHVAAFGPDPRNAILLAGFQAGGTRGATLLAGRRTLRMFGREVQVNAEVIEFQGLSGHADADGIFAWARAGSRPRQTFVTHGEPDASDVLRARFERELKWPARVPEHLECVSLDDAREHG
jgi:metallo-beta-lactamase family protein